jgi:hypothetical protein
MPLHVRRPRPGPLRQRQAVGVRAVRDGQHRGRSRLALAAHRLHRNDTPFGQRTAQRGTNALIIEEILKAMSPSPVRPAEIRKALKDNGVAISFPSIHHALRQLEAHNAAEQVDDSKGWRHRGGNPS